MLSPGPGNPSDFGLSQTLELLSKHTIPTFGVCLGLQGMVEYFGGKLGILSYPMHGKPSMITLTAAGKAEGRYVSIIKSKVLSEIKFEEMTLQFFYSLFLIFLLLGSDH